MDYPKVRQLIPLLLTKQKMKKEQSFYVGYLPVPLAVKKFLFITVTGVVGISLALACFLAMQQTAITKGNFEYGTRTQISGILVNMPVPMLLVQTGKTNTNSFQFSGIPLVGYGKHGADGILDAYTKSTGHEIVGHVVTLSGTLIYRDGKSLLELTDKVNSIVFAGKAVSMSQVQMGQDLGTVTLKGEIIDPKCFFGVMNPGQGKPHRSCAIRCISGGIPPVFHVQNSKGERGYFLIRGRQGEAINNQLLDFVAEPVTIKGKLKQYQDWMVIEMSEIKR